MLFALLWMSCFTLIVLFVPRLTAMLTKNNEKLEEADSGVRTVGEGGFSFLSMASFDTVSSAGGGAIGQYLAALELHLAQAKARHSQLKSGDVKGKEWMKATTTGAAPTNQKQPSGTAVAGRETSVSAAPQQQQQQRRAREKSIATTVTAAAKPSISYMTQTNYNSDAAIRSSIAAGPSSSSPAAVGQQQRGKLQLAASSRGALPSGGSSSSGMAQTPTTANTSPVQDAAASRNSPSSRAVQMTELNQQQKQPASATTMEVVTAAGDTTASGRPASVSRSRSARVQPSFEPAAPIQDRPSSSGGKQLNKTQQPNDHKPEEEQKPQQQQPKADTSPPVQEPSPSSQYALSSLPTADDMVVHDLSHRIARASINEGDQHNNSTVGRQPTSSMRAQASSSSRGILMTPVTGSATLGSGDGIGGQEVENQEGGHGSGGELDIETGDAMQDIE